MTDPTLDDLTPEDADALGALAVGAPATIPEVALRLASATGETEERAKENHYLVRTRDRFLRLKRHGMVRSNILTSPTQWTPTTEGLAWLTAVRDQTSSDQAPPPEPETEHQLPLIGFERAVTDRLSRALHDTANRESDQHSVVVETPRGNRFEVVTGNRIIRVTIEVRGVYLTDDVEVTG